MQQSLTDNTTYEEYGVRRSQRPVLMKRAQFAFVAVLVLLDIACTWVAFYAGWWLLDRNPDVIIGPFQEFWPLPTVYTALLVGISSSSACTSVAGP
ncbi:MAG: hypothetical protein R2851_14225 [Caldilineaceae bacterium]